MHGFPQVPLVCVRSPLLRSLPAPLPPAHSPPNSPQTRILFMSSTPSDSKSELKSQARASGSGNDRDSILYKEFLAERDEILRHKWIESEKAGHDIGFEKALLDWIVRFRASWRQQRQQGLPFTKAG